MKKVYLILTVFTFLAGITMLNSCKKDETENTDIETLNQEQSADEEDVSASSDAIDDEIDLIMSATSLKTSSVGSLPCNVTVDSSLITNKKLTITFNGDNCYASRTRSGKIEITLSNGEAWKDAGAVLTVKYTNVKIIHKASQRYTILNGTKTHTNVSGGLVWKLGQVGNPETVVRRIESDNMNITFSNGTQRTWSIARQRSFTKVNGNILIMVSGFGEADGKTNLVEWGTNRRNNAFYTQITNPVIMSQACDYKPSSGEKIHYLNQRTVNVMLGTDENGNPISEGCADYYKISWTGVGGTKTVILPY